MPATRDSSRLRIFGGVLLLALVVRGVQWWLQQADPLFWNPLGGNLPYLLLGERIAAGEWLPLDGRPFTISSPLYPWIIGMVFGLVGESDPGAVRAAGGMADALTCGLLAVLAARRFGPGVGWATGILAALYAPLVHFSVEIAAVPFTLLFLVGGLLVVDVALERAAQGAGTGARSGRLLHWVAGGCLVGLAVATRPNLLIGAALLPLVPWFARMSRGASLRGGILLAAGLALGIAPVTLANRASSGEWVLLTVGAGHNFYIGHNPMAQPQYSLPLPLDGDIFESMKSAAESELGRPLADTEVSGFYLSRAVEEIRAAPGREVTLTYNRMLSVINDFEATTYSSFEYQKEFSPLLAVFPTFALLFGLALVGFVVAPPTRETAHLLIPAVAGIATVLLFFYIARLRILLVPTLLIWAGVGIVAGVRALRGRRWSALAVFGVLAAAGWGLSSLPRFQPDPSNEWNKAGGVLRVRGFPEEAERFLLRAVEANPSNPASWQNLVRVYEDLGRPEDAADARLRAEELESRAESEATRFRAEIGGSDPR